MSVSVTIYDTPRNLEEGVRVERLSAEVLASFYTFAHSLYGELMRMPLGQRLGYIKLAPVALPSGRPLRLHNSTAYAIDATISFAYPVYDSKKPAEIALTFRSDEGYKEIFVRAGSIVDHEVLRLIACIRDRLQKFAERNTLAWKTFESEALAFASS